MLRLSSTLIQELKVQNISELTVRIISGGCAGKKVDVVFEAPEDISEYETTIIEGLSIWIPKNQKEQLEGGLLGKIEKGWIFTHPEIKSRCGCATSFSFEKKGKIASLHVLKDLKNQFINK